MMKFDDPAIVCTMLRQKVMEYLTHDINTLRPRQNGRHFTDDFFKRIFVNENIWIPIKISLKFVPKGSVNNIPALVQIMAWRRPGDKPLSEPMMVNLPTHICVTRPQWVKYTKSHLGKKMLFAVNCNTRVELSNCNLPLCCNIPKNHHIISPVYMSVVYFSYMFPSETSPED